MAAKDTVALVASLTVTSPLGVETVKTFDRAWHRALVLPRPVTICFNEFVRKEKL